LTTAWFDEESRLTPEELQTVTFPMSRLGRRGYEEEPVRGFLGLVYGEFVRLVNERASLWQEVQRLRRRIPHFPRQRRPRPPRRPRLPGNCLQCTQRGAARLRLYAVGMMHTL